MQDTLKLSLDIIDSVYEGNEVMTFIKAETLSLIVPAGIVVIFLHSVDQHMRAGISLDGAKFDLINGYTNQKPELN